MVANNALKKFCFKKNVYITSDDTSCSNTSCSKGIYLNAQMILESFFPFEILFKKMKIKNPLLKSEAV